ncbi:MAG: bacillithiol biosynthesis deacetylase BshB1 [Chlorobiaceae bacterium]|nr:bacillithiol biosynthesis deacetylase BshB1 [Chlorobiaceae bacterium]
MEHSSEHVYALAFGAHPDDVELACGATLLKIMQEGNRVAVCDLTKGELGTLGSVETRNKEADKACAVMGYAHRVRLDLGDGKLWYNDENLHSVISIIRRFRPQVVFANPPDERHPDHIKASKLIADAVYYAGLKQLITHDDTRTAQKPHRPSHLFHYLQFKHIDPDIIIDISDTFERSRAGILAFGSQFYREGSEPETLINRKEFLTGLEARARYLGEQIGTMYGEGLLTTKIPAIRNFSALFE